MFTVAPLPDIDAATLADTANVSVTTLTELLNEVIEVAVALATLDDIAYEPVADSKLFNLPLLAV